MLKFLVTLLFSLTALALDAKASDPLSSAPSKARLFQAETSDGAWGAGLEITLADGWKTYWRMPGDAGVPPQFDWSASTNLKAVTIGWPAPRRYRDAAGETVGYTSQVVFPLHIEPQDAARPVELKLSLFYGVCKDICIPAEAKLALTHLPGAQLSEADRELLERFTAQVPGVSSSSLIPPIKSLRLTGSAAEPVLEASFNGPVPVAPTDIFVEGHSQAYFHKPEAAKSGDSVFRLRVNGLKDPSQLRGKQLTLTLVSGRASLVQTLAVE